MEASSSSLSSSSSSGGRDDVAELGLTSRLAGAANPQSPACDRVRAMAANVHDRLAELEASGGATATPLRGAVIALAQNARAFDGLIFGELHRVHAAMTEDGVLAPEEVQLLAATFEAHARQASGAREARGTLGATVGQLLSGSDDPRRMMLGRFFLHVGSLMADVHACAP